MKKNIIDFVVVENTLLSHNYSLLKLTPESGDKLPDSMPGQFVQVAVDNSKTTFLRRPVSINYVDRVNNRLWLLVRNAGDGTAAIMRKRPGDKMNVICPLGNGFSMPVAVSDRLLLVGGGVGVAPLLELGAVLKARGFQPEFLLGARSADDILESDMFEAIGPVHIATDDGSAGHHGLVTQHPVIQSGWDRIYCCGPAPMMKAVARCAAQSGIDCEVSLENMMACGVGACLCCVEKTVKGNVCVCTEGPVFNINQLTW